MADKSFYLADALLNAILTNGTLPSIAQTYLALNTTTSTPFTPGTECTDARYARQTIGWEGMSDGVDEAGTIGNGGNFFGLGAITGATIVEVAIYDSAPGGNELFFAAITPVTVNAGDTTSLSPSEVTLNETGKAYGVIASTSNAILSGGSYTGPTTVYAALNTTTSTPSAPGTEVVDANYARLAITFGAASGGSDSNTSAVTFFAPSGAASIQSVVEVALYDSLSGGNELYFGSFSRSLGVGDQALLKVTTGVAVAES